MQASPIARELPVESKGYAGNHMQLRVRKMHYKYSYKPQVGFGQKYGNGLKYRQPLLSKWAKSLKTR